MVVILDYNKSLTNPLAQILESQKAEFKYSLNESEIVNSEKIILPELENFDKTYRKLQLTNIFNLLKIYGKPILSLGNGFCLMANKIFDRGKIGLCFFDVHINVDVFETHNNFTDGFLTKLKDTKLLININSGEKVMIDKNLKVIHSNYTTSIVNYKNEKYALTSEYKNYFAIHFDISQNRDLGEKIIGNFVRL